MVGEESQCPDCNGRLVMTKKGWECLNPECDVIQVSTRRGHGWKETKVTRRTIVIQGGNVND